MTPRPAPTTTIATALLIAIATAPLRDVFGDWRWAIGITGAAFAAALLASLVETVRPGLPPAAITVSVAVAAIVWTLAITLRASFWAAPLSGRVWADLGDGIFSGWSALLDEQLPPTDPQRAQVFMTVLVWAVAALAVHGAARIRTALPAIGGAAFVLCVSTAAALPRGLSPAMLGGGVGAVALFAVATHSRAVDQGWRRGRIVALVVMITVAGAIATLAGMASSSRDASPVDPRATRDTETVVIEVPDVLAEYGERRRGEQTVLTIDSTVPPAGLRLRLQVYDDHDGERWLPATAFEATAALPDATVRPPGDRVAFTVQFEELAGPWIPLPDRVISIDAPNVLWNADTQTMIAENRPTQYGVVGTLVPRTDLEGVEIDRDGVAANLSTAPVGLPETIRALAEEATADTTDAVSAIDALTDRLRDLGRDESVPPGNSLGRLRDDLEAGEPTGAEQIASLHALMLRSVGIPSRLVVGYVANGSEVVADDLVVWVEVAFDDIGWVAFEPVPAGATSGTDTTEDPVATTTTVPTDPALEARAEATRLGPGQDPGDDRTDIGDRAGQIGVAVLGALAAMVLLVSLVGTRVVRRALRRSEDGAPDVRVLGAWAEMVDRFRELGAPITRTTTTGDVVDIAAGIDEEVAAHAAAVAELAAQALHAPQASTADDATAAWSELRHAEARLKEVGGPLSPARRYLDPRVLRYGAPRPPATRRTNRGTRVS